MHEIPDCLNRRYTALDELVTEISNASERDFHDASGASCNDPGVRLMCDFWNILKDNPDCNLTKAVQSRLDLSPRSSMFLPQKISCYMAQDCKKTDEVTTNSESEGKADQCCPTRPEPAGKFGCCGSKPVSSSRGSNDTLPLSKVLCNLKEAASFGQKCQGMVNDLLAAQKKLQGQIQHLEHREQEGLQQLKKADCMWSCMEDAYKKKILGSQERQKTLIKQLKEADANTNKWRKNKKELEFQMENVNTCYQEIVEKLHQKQSDLNCMTNDIADYKKRIENHKKEIEATKKSVGVKKNATDDKIKRILDDVYKREAIIKEEKARKEKKEEEGNRYIKEARADLLNLSKVLLQKRIEKEDMKTEKETLIDELEVLAQSYDQCKDRCQLKKQSIENEIKIINDEIKNYKAKCIRCHQCTDTIDIRNFCIDCPRCIEERECLYKEGQCTPDHTMDCVCMCVKQKFLNNVFENMYTVLERQIKTGPGKSIAETVLNCLKRSRNGKLDQQTRQILQDFILTTVKKNLNLTIIGGAVKTRCELDAETYKQLMLCLSLVKAVRPPKADKETAAKKPPCPRWGGESECHCPKGPKACICTKRAPPPPNELAPCPPQDKEDKGEEKICPHKESIACGPDCAMHAVPSAVGTDVAAWRPDPCQGSTCMFKNMRAAQCVLGPEALNSMFDSRSFVTAVPYVPKVTTEEDQMSCKCGSTSTKPCICKDVKTHPRERIIEEVMGKYFEVTPIDKVSTENGHSVYDSKIRRNNKNAYICIDTPIKNTVRSIESLYYNCLSNSYTDVNKPERDEMISYHECTSKYGSKDMIEKNMGPGLKYVDDNQYFKADLKIATLSYPESATSVKSTKSEKKFVTENDSNPLFREKVRTVTQKLLDDVIAYDCDSKQDSLQEWISLETFVNHIMDKQYSPVDTNDPENNETEIETQYLDNSETKPTHNVDSITTPKQMKEDIKAQCDNKTCSVQRSNFHRDELSSFKPQFYQNDILPGHDLSWIPDKSSKSYPTEKVTVDRKIKAELIKDQFQPLLITKSLHKENEFFKSNSKDVSQNNVDIYPEPLKMEMDEKMIELIQNIINRDPSSFVSLKKTKSGHMALGLNSVNHDDGEVIVVKNSKSGKMIIEIDKSTVRSTSSDNGVKELSIDRTNKAKNIGIHVPKYCIPQCSKNKEFSHNVVKKLLLRNSKKDFGVCKSNRKTVTKEFLQKYYQRNHRNIKIRFIRHCKELINDQATLLQISFENIAIHVKNVSIVDDDRVELPVLLQRTESGTVNIYSDVDVMPCNGVAKRTTSNGLLIFIRQSYLHNIKLLPEHLPKTEDVFKIRIKGIDDDIKEPPAVIKRTPSGNFDVVLEKEFEKYFKETIRDQKIEKEDNESFIDLTKTSSSVILDFENDDSVGSLSQKALLMKSNSGLLKIIVSDSTQNATKEIGKRKKSMTFGSIISAKALGELLRQLPSRPTLQNTEINETVTKNTRSSSDSHLYETAKIKLHSNQSLLEKSSTTLKKTSSGQYALVLDKDLKKSFINHLLSYLDKSTKGVIPIKRTNSGEITITFDKNTKVGEYGSLKITSSGNIYVILDDKNITQVSNTVGTSATSNSNESGITTYISKIENPEDKAIATNCNAYPHDSLCASSKCVCENLNTKSEHVTNLFINTANANEIYGNCKCSGVCDKQCDKSPHIVIRTCESSLESDNCNKFQESYYCEVQSVCPYRKDRYETVSNELLEISGLCNKVQDKQILSEVETDRKMMPDKNENHDFNSFDYLPHQLPHFLRNFTKQ